MDTLTKSCSPVIVIRANGEVQTHEEATVHVKELDTFLTMKVLEDTPAVLSLGKGLRWTRIILWVDQWSKNYISFKTVVEYNGTRKTLFRSWFLACEWVLPQACPLQHPWHLQGSKLIILHFLQASLLHQPQLCQATVRPERGKTWVKLEFLYSICIKYTCWKGKNREDPLTKPTKNPKPKYKRRPRFRTGRLVSFRHTRMAARI